MKQFSPMLACNQEVDLNNIKYPKMASYKLDGIRVVFHPKLGMVSRALKPIQNKQLQEKFKYILDHAESMNRIFDGELYAHGRTFQEITRAVMTKDFNDGKTFVKLQKEYGPNAIIEINSLIADIKFHCFETHYDEAILNPETFINKSEIIKNVSYASSYVPVVQKTVNSAQDVEAMFETALKDGYEGLILRDPGSPYKFGRSTLKEEYMLKVKPYKTFDARIMKVIQATEVDPNAEKTINELGRSVTSKKKGDRVLIEKASAFKVNWNWYPLKVSLAMTDEEKEEVWKNRDSYVGKMIEYKGMMIGAKDVPRHPVFVRFRSDRD